MLELTLVRHASTRLNEQRRYQGRTDAPLSPRGHVEAERLGHRLAGRIFDVVACSAARRCLETVRVAIPDREPVVDPRWGELDFGEWDGRTYDQCAASHPEHLRRWITAPTRHAPPGGEPFSAFRRRVDGALAALPRAGSALVVAHGGPIRRVLARTLGLPWSRVVLMEISACGISRLALHPEGAHLRALNDTAHLEQRWT